jgi:hypothetical protein
MFVADLGQINGNVFMNLLQCRDAVFIGRKGAVLNE